MFLRNEQHELDKHTNCNDGLHPKLMVELVEFPLLIPDPRNSHPLYSTSHYKTLTTELYTELHMWQYACQPVASQCPCPDGQILERIVNKCNFPKRGNGCLAWQISGRCADLADHHDIYFHPTMYAFTLNPKYTPVSGKDTLKES